MSIRFAGHAGHAGHVPPTREANGEMKCGTGKTSPASPASPADRSAPDSGRNSDYRELASVLAGGVRRLLERSWPGTTSDAKELDVSLDVSRPESPHVVREPRTRRAS